MKHIFYLINFLFLSLLMSCSEIPPTNIDEDPLTKKPVPPAPAQPLVLLDNANQIVAIWRDQVVDNGTVGVWNFDGLTYSKSWEKSGEGTYDRSAIGDIDNDGNDELVAVYVYETGRGKAKTTHRELHVFENGAVNGPARISSNLIEDGINGILYMRLGDANNDGVLEIMLACWNCVCVYKDDGTALQILWKSEDLSAVDPWSIDAGDADNDEQNEIIYAELGGKRFGVYEYLGSNNWGNKVYSESVACGLDRAFVADVDGDNLNEIVGGGCDLKLFVWKQVDGNYVIVFESDNLGGFTQGVAAGDFDNDNLTEIAVGTAGGDNKVYVFKYNGASYSKVFEESITGMVNDMYAGDSDNDDIDEIIVASGENLLVYDFLTGYSRTFSVPGSISSVMVN